jgi:succinate dehydrogenase/fumarate reductase cytochrome b subunit
MHLSPTLIILAKATLAFPFCFHFVNGIRHLVSVIFLNASNLLSYGIIK